MEPEDYAAWCVRKIALGKAHPRRDHALIYLGALRFVIDVSVSVIHMLGPFLEGPEADAWFAQTHDLAVGSRITGEMFIGQVCRAWPLCPGAMN